jgi:signal transduction histidine kinase
MVSSAHALGTPDQAKAMVDKAIAYVKANGKDKAFAEVDNQKGQFIKEDLYVWISDMKGLILAHGANEKLIGKDVSPLKDSDGKFFIKEIIEQAKAKGSGWVDYHWIDPVTKAIEKKSTYFKKDGEMIYACGIYKK